MKLSDYFKYIRPNYVYLEIIPHKSTRNYNSSNIAKAIARTYKSINNRIYKENKKLCFSASFKISYIIDIKATDVKFFFIIPEVYKNIIVEKIKEIWNKSTIEIVDKIEDINDKSEVYQLSYKKDDALSLFIDKKSNEPLNSILNVKDIMKESDRLTISYNFIPSHQTYWIDKYEEVMKKIEEHKVIDKKQFNFECITKYSISFLYEIINGFIEIIDDFTGSPKKTNNNNFLSLFDIIDKKKELSASTKRKKEATILNTQIAVISNSTDSTRQLNNALSVCQAYRVLDEDNELIYKQVKNDFKLDDYDYKIDTNIFSTDEITNFIQLPGRRLLNDFKINHINIEETEVPAELRKGYINLGFSTYKGNKINAYLEEEYNIGNTPLITIGGQGSGKSTYIQNVAKNCIDNNEGIIILDFIKNCELSEDIKQITPVDRLIEIDLASENDIQGLGYNEIKITNNMSNFEKLDLANKQSDQLMNLIDAVGIGENLSSSMRRFFSAAAIVVMVQGYNSVKNVIECLEYYKKRQQYIDRLDANLKKELEDELNTLDELNDYDKSGIIKGTKYSKIQYIIDRIYMLRSDFKLKYMYNKALDKNINLIECMNKNKVVLIKMKEGNFPSKMVKNVLITYWLTKIWLATQLRGMQFKKPNRVNVFIDELFQAPTSMNVLIDILTQSRKFGTKFIMSTHYIKQLEPIFEALLTANSSFMLLRGCTENDFNHFKNKLDNFEYEDLRDMKQYSSLNIIYYSKGYSSFITELPKPIQ